MQIIDLFSGIGGFSLSGRWIGWKTIQFVEINEFCQKVLAYHFPGVPIHGDIKTLDYEQIKQRIDPSCPTIVVGGFPCQPYSTAGRRKGTEDDRHLWPYCLEAIKQLRPDFCVFENVHGIVTWNGGLVFEEVQAEMEAEGYEVQTFLLPACGVGAPHKRERVWFVAHSVNNSNSSDRRPQGEENSLQGKRRETGQSGEPVGADNTLSSDPKLFGQPRQGRAERSSDTEAYKDWKASWSYADGGWPLESPFCPGDDGLSPGLSDITFSSWRKESITAVGNSVVPALVLQIFKAIQQYENN